MDIPFVIAKELPEFKAKVKVYQKIKGKFVRVRWVVVKSAWEWNQVGSGYSALGLRVEIKIAASKRMHSVKTKSRFSDVALKGQNITVRLRSMKTKIKLKFKSNKGVNLYLVVDKKDKKLFDVNCQDAEILVTGERPRASFFMTAECFKEGSGHFLTLSFPKEVQIQTSTLLERDGKGESWLVFSLGNLIGVSGEVGKISFRYKKRNYSYSIFKKKEAKPAENPIYNSFVIGVGYGSIKLAGDQDVDILSPFVSLRILPQPVWWRLSFGMTATLAVSVENNIDTISYMDLSAYGVFYIWHSSTTEVGLLTTLSLTSQKHTQTGLAYRFSQAGAGIKVGQLLYKNYWFDISLRSDQLGTKNIVNHINIDINVLKRVAREELLWGGGLSVNNVSVIDEDATLSQFDTTLLYGLVTF